MKVTIITPSYNQSQFIKQTIDSVLNQSYNNIEYIIYDACSNDGTLEILESYKYRLIYFSEKDSGQTNAINKGLKKATGDILCFINSDDYFPNYAIEHIVEIFNNNPSIKWISGDYIIVDQNGKEIQSIIAKYKNFLKLFPFNWIIKITNPIIQPSTFWRKEVFEEFGEFNESLIYTMDYEYWLKISKKYKPYFTNKVLSYFRIHKNSKGGAHFEKQFAEEIEVAKKNRVKGINLLLHRLHNFLIITIYKIIK